MNGRPAPTSRVWCLLVPAGFLLAGLTGCRLSTRPGSGASAARLLPSDSLALGAPAVAIATDGTGLVVLDLDGSRIVRFDEALQPSDTYLLNPRIIGARGLLADRFYLYVFDDSRLYRMARAERRVETWLNNIRSVGVAGYAPGEVIVSESGHGSIWHKTLFMESRRLTAQSEVREPGALAALPSGGFAVLSGTNALVEIDRMGIVARRRLRPPGTDLIESDAAGVLYLMQRGTAMLWLITQHGGSQHELAGVQSSDDVAVVGPYVVVLDRANRLIRFRPSVD
ncbi:MAG: hypothetical protein R6X13_10510 [bacterium]